MTTRKGAAKWTGSGYRNLRQFPKDSSIHAQSARGMKQVQRVLSVPMALRPISVRGHRIYIYTVNHKKVSIFWKRGGNGILAFYEVNGKPARDKFGRIKKFSWSDDIDGLANEIEKEVKRQR